MLQEPEDRLLFGFLLIVGVSPVLTILHSGSLTDAAGELFALSMLALYFPIRETCVRHRAGVYVVLAALLFVAAYVGVRNLINYHTIIARATQLWQVEKGRAATNDTLLLAASCFTLVSLVYVRRWRAQLTLGSAFAFFLVGLILTQSRGYWVSFLVSCGLLLWMLDKAERLRAIKLGAATMGLILVVAVIALGDLVRVVVEALVERFASTSTSDLSLIGRLYEAEAVWQRVMVNPIVGYGTGVPYHFYDLFQSGTRVDTFTHNGYLALWYKFGIVGLLLMLGFLIRSLYIASCSGQRADVPIPLRVGAIGGAMALLAVLIAANTSNPFHLNDMTFTIAVITGVGGAARAWLRHPQLRFENLAS